MYEQFYHLTEKPFTLLPDPGFLYMSDKHRMAATLLEYGLNDHAGFTVISGEIGAGKTTLIRHMLNNMEQEYTVGLISNTHRSFGDLLQWILLAYDLDHKDMSKVEMYQRFVDFVIGEYARNHRTVLIIDEAQNMDAETLEELRMLSNINADKDIALQVILVGQRELRDTLRCPELVQFAQRITVDYHLEPLSTAETAGYIRHRMKVAGGDPDTFTSEACQAVYRHSGGVPRLINLLCDTALVYGFAEQSRRIEARLVDDVAREKQQGGIFPVHDATPEPLQLRPEPVQQDGAGDEPAGGESAAPDDQPAGNDPAAAVKETVGPVTGRDVVNTADETAPVVVPIGAAPEPVANNRQPATEIFEAAAEPQAPGQPVDNPHTQVAEAVDEAIEQRWLHGAGKKKLRVAVFSGVADCQRYLERLLAGYEFEVSLLAHDGLVNGAARPDLLLIDYDINHVLPSFVIDLVAAWNGPVLYNDADVTASSLENGNPDLGLQLSNQIHSLAGSLPVHAAV